MLKTTFDLKNIFLLLLTLLLGVSSLAQPASSKSKSSKKDLNEVAVPDLVEGEVSSLGRLAPFDDVAVIQRRFLPKASRFEFSPSLGLIINQPFFLNIEFTGRFGYYITDSYGLESSFLFIGKSEKGVTKDLREKRKVITTTLVSPKSYFGLDFKWTPVYGKMGLLNESVVPFDLFLLGGMGVTQTNQDESPITIHFGVGQIFAISKSMAARWDLGWYWYSTTNPNDATLKNRVLDLHATFGISFFFPGAKYR